MVIYVKSNIVPWSKSFHWRFYQQSKPQIPYVWRSSSQKHPTFNVFTETTLDLSLYHNLPSKKYKKYTIRSIVCETSCHPVTQSFGHVIIWPLGHSVTQSLGHSVTQPLGYLVTQSLFYSTLLWTDSQTDNIRIYRSASQTNNKQYLSNKFWFPHL